MLLAGAAFFVPHAGKDAPKHRHLQPAAITRVVPTPVGVVTISEDFALPAEFAYDDLIEEAAERYGLNPELIRAVITAESAFNPLAVSRVGAQGLMQLMPALAKELGVIDAFDPRQNIMAGSRYLSQLLDARDGNVALALASYNAGPSTVDRYHGIPPYKETQKYVKRITGLVARAEAAEEQEH
jgi:soluble lytic murein transglycosylase-like protein